MMKIVKASAGSGKTYMLANEYIDLLLKSDDEYAYRHILGVTFTNKATAEMKNRIIRFLYDRSLAAPKARRLLINMLHDYSAFSISTIDKFFQQTLRSFSREIGQFSSYQIELDRDALIGEAVDRMLDSLTDNDKALISWLTDSAREQIEAGERLRLEDGLYKMGRNVKSDAFRELREKAGMAEEQLFDKARIKKLNAECRDIIDRREERVKAARDKVLEVLKTNGLDASKTSRGWLNQIYKPGEPTEAFRRVCRTPEKWFAKSNVALLPSYRAVLEEPLADLADALEPNAQYETVKKLSGTLSNLGLAMEFFSEFDRLLKEKNLMCLDDSNAILRDIIGGTDAPFIYEKMGTRYDHFLLDEFQDTSNIQWANFLPLLKESDSNGNYNLIVGDVKQSIYRWRNSEWKLLADEVEKAFPAAAVISKQENWRSLSAVVDFNNDFFEFAAKHVQMETIYSDVRQKVKSGDTGQPGSVEVLYRDNQLEAIVAQIENALDRGAHYGDICILVRGNKSGASIAAHLTASNIPVISGDSLKCTSSSVVRRMLALLAGIENPEDAISRHLVQSLNICIPMTYYSLADLCEGLLRSLRDADEQAFADEAAYIQTFMDDLQSWVKINGNNLRRYLQHMDEKAPCVASPEQGDSVMILTVHKAKGLQAPYVIFPFAENVSLFKHESRWCSMDASVAGLPDYMDGIYNVSLSSSCNGTAFSDAYLEEKALQAVDALNLFYVAFTRAEKELCVISSPTVKSNQMMSVLKAWIGDSDYFYGERYDYRRMSREVASEAEAFDADYVSIAPNPELEDGSILCRFMAGSESNDFFGEDGVGITASARLNGIVLHDILASIDRPEDLDSAVSDAVRKGFLAADSRDEVYSLLRDSLNGVEGRGWFCGTSALRERTVIDNVNGEFHRPDRVVINGDSVIIIDYKFGEKHRNYDRQLRRYMDLYLRMGYSDVSGYLWYVQEGEVVPVLMKKG